MSMTAQNLVDFLLNRGWSSVFTDGFFKLSPSSGLGLPDTYRLFIKRDIDGIDNSSYLKRIIRNISIIYRTDIDELIKMVESMSTILSIRIYDSDQYGIELPKLDSFLTNLSKWLEDTAAFVVTKKPKLEDNVHEAKEYLSKCNFIKTEKGSFVAKIELPSRGVLKEANLFEDQISNNDVNVALEKTLFLVKESVDNGEENFREIISNNRNLINLDILEDIRDVYSDTGISNIDYNFNFPERTTTIVMNDFNSQKIESLNSFIEVIRKELEDRIYNVSLVNGFVYSLSSKDPFEDRNKIRIFGLENNLKQPITVVLKLDSDQYVQAINAHKDKKQVTLSGKAVKRKKEYHIVELDNIDFG